MRAIREIAFDTGLVMTVYGLLLVFNAPTWVIWVVIGSTLMLVTLESDEVTEVGKPKRPTNWVSPPANPPQE